MFVYNDVGVITDTTILHVVGGNVMIMTTNSQLCCWPHGLRVMDPILKDCTIG